MVLIPEVPLFLKKGSVFGVTLHAANTEHQKKFAFFVRILPLEDNTEHLTSYKKSILKPKRFGLQETLKQGLKMSNVF